MSIDTIEIERKSAGVYSWFAQRDAWIRSSNNACRFTETQHIKAQRIKFVLELVYYSKDITIDNCKKWIRVKVHNASVKNSKILKELETDWALQGITKVYSGNGVIYRVI